LLPGVQPLRVMADGQGRFGFRDLPAGSFNLTATRPGWTDGAYGRTRPGGPTLPLRLTDGERASGVAVSLWRFATIAGRVTDESGDPLVNAPVQVLRRSTVGGRTKLIMSTQDSTDDQGSYRIGMLEPGEYVVAVAVQPPSSQMPFMAADGPMIRDVMVTARAAVASAPFIRT
jgi:hypothetical protein